MIALLLCTLVMWRVVLFTCICFVVLSFIESCCVQLVITVSISSRMPEAIELMPSAILAVRLFFLKFEVGAIALGVGTIGNAYRYYRILYPKFIRGGRNAVAFFWSRTSSERGCPATGCKVAWALASQVIKS